MMSFTEATDEMILGAEAYSVNNEMLLYRIMDKQMYRQAAGTYNWIAVWPYQIPEKDYSSEWKLTNRTCACRKAGDK